MLTLVDGTPLYGIPAAKTGADFLILEDAFFISGNDETDVNLLRRFGNEIHRPLPFVAVPWMSVLYQEPLATSSPALAAIIQFEQSNPATTTPTPSIGNGDPAAVFLKNGDVFFGSAVSDGAAVFLSDAYFLRFKDDNQADEGEITSLDQVELVPQSQTSSGPTGDMSIPLSSILYMQNLGLDSPVLGAMGQ